MTQQEKDLLLKDLCARLPYGVKIWYKYGAWYPKKFATSIRLADEKIALSHIFNKEGEWFPIEEAEEILIKPYLRPMESMTEEEKNGLKEYLDAEEVDCNGFGYSEGGTLEDYISSIPYSICIGVDDWLNAHHFDYRNLIEKGLAIEVTGENNPYKNHKI